jgi:hypothetical protein
MKKYIFTDNKKLFNKIFAGALAFIIALSLVAVVFLVDSFAIANPKCYHKFLLSTFHGSYDKKDMPKTYWQVRSYKDKETNEVLPLYAKAKLSLDSLGNNHLGQIWIYVSDFAGDKLEITVGQTEQNETLNKKGAYKITAEDIKNSKDGWFKVYDYTDKTNFKTPMTSITIYWIGFSTDIRIREMVFIDKHGAVADGVDEIKEYLGKQENSGYADLDNPISNAVDEKKFFNLGLVDIKK